MAIRGFAAFALLVAAMSAAQGNAADAAPEASFDCASAGAPIEKLICSNDELTALDAAVARAYEAQRRASRRDQLSAARREQRQWLLRRNSTCTVPSDDNIAPTDTAISCLIGLYRERLAALASATPVPPTPGKIAAVGAGANPVDGSRQEQVFAVDRAGRYAIRAESSSGTGLQVIDRMAGPSPLAGEAGKRDGRLDLLLDRGSYKAVMLRPEGSQDHATLHVDGFRELNGANSPLLVELKPVESDLDDLTQRSWWLDIPKRRTVALEAAGRYLADLRLWKDGTWLVDAEPTEAEVEPEPGHSLAVRRLAVTLEPGLYLVTAYGGAGEAWAKGSDAKPLFLRFGIPVVAEAARIRHVASPFGIDRFLVPKPANHFRLRLDRPDTAALTVTPYDPSNPFSAGSDRGEIAKNSRDPVVDITAPALSDFSLVTVERKPNQPYLLQNFYSARSYDFHGDGNYWIEVISAATSDDDADLTGALTRMTSTGERLVAASAIELAPGKPWRRRFNLLDRTTLYVAIAESGNYLVTAEGENVDAEFRFEPLGPRPQQYRVPAFERGDHVWTLESGVYLLTIQPRPEKDGIATLTLKPAGYTGDIAIAPRHSVIAWRDQSLRSLVHYQLYVNQVRGVSNGLVLRPLPLDLAADLPMTLAPGEHVELPVMIGDEGTISAQAEDGKPVALALDGQTAAATSDTTAGNHHIVLANDGDRPLSLSLHIQRNNMRPEAPLPVLSSERLQALPTFPVLTAEKPVFLDVEREGEKTYNIAVGAPALYRLESGGLLHTAGNLRTRMVTSLARADANGVGRNFIIQRYLREGDYQLSFAPQGASAGHMSLALTATPIEDRGVLTLAIPSRATLRPGRAVRYDFRIDHKARYRLQAFGMNRQFALRVEDEDGWPVATPVVDGVMEQDFLPGLYHATLMPSVVEARSLILLEELVPPPDYVGHGPHTIALGGTISHEWLEPENGGERIPDRWRFHVPAPTELAVEISDGMAAKLLREDLSGGKEVVRLIRAPGWSGNVDAGDYHLEVVSIHPNNHLPYTLTLRSDQLLIGQSRRVTAPAEIPIALGSNDLVDLSSFGTGDVRARLYDATGHLIAANDDRTDDWNFDIAATLAPGRYRVQIDPVGAARVETRVDLRRPEEKTEPPFAIPGTAEVSDAALHTFPLAPVPQSGLLLIGAQSADPVSLSLEQPSDDGHWRTVATAAGQSPLIAIPVEMAGAGYRVRAWSIDRKMSAIKLVSRLWSPQPTSEAELAVGLALRRIEGFDPPVWAGAILPVRPGVIRLEGSETLRWTGASGTAAASDPSALAIAGSSPVWLVDRGTPMPLIRGARVDLTEETRLALPPGEAALSFARPGKGPVLWLAQSRFGQPGMVVGAADEAASAMGVAANSTVAVATSSNTDTSLRLWNASDRSVRLQFTLRRIDFPEAASEDFPPSERGFTLAPRSARALMLGGAGAKRIHLLLPPEMAAVLRQGGRTLATLWPDRDSRSYTAELSVDSILLLNIGEKEARATLTWSNTDKVALTLTPGRVFKRYEGAAGTLLLDVPLEQPGPYKLRLATGATARFVTRDGRVTQGDDVALPGAGMLAIEHKPGLVAAWIEDESKPEVTAALTLGGAARIVNLAGPSMRFATTADASKLLSLRTTAPVIASIIGPDGRTTTEVFPEGGRLSRYLPPGRTVIELQSAAEGDLAGDAEFIERPVTPIAEGLGEAIRLGAGETQIYSFTLPAERTIGVGLRASVDIAHCRLLDSKGQALGSGIVQMHKLPAGTFLLAVDMPPNADPVEIRPALVGTHEPDSGPPDEVKRHYLQLVGKLPSQ